MDTRRATNTAKLLMYKGWNTVREKTGVCVRTTLRTCTPLDEEESESEGGGRKGTGRVYAERVERERNRMWDCVECRRRNEPFGHFEFSDCC